MIASGTGPGTITADGCAVEVYLHFPPQGEAELVHAAAGPGTAVLDLGCGTGRIAHPLIALGHPVVAVDESAQMLAHVRGAETVHAEITRLELGRAFDVVLMASHLVNTVDNERRRALLASAARHLAPGGLLVVEQYPPAWFDEVSDRADGRLGEVAVDLHDVRRDGNVVTATVRYRMGGRTWTQTFDALRLSAGQLHAELLAAGLSFDRWLRPDRSWFAARRP
jgi:SAM-dependent methyltransferase